MTRNTSFGQGKHIVAALATIRVMSTVRCKGSAGTAVRT